MNNDIFESDNSSFDISTSDEELIKLEAYLTKQKSKGDFDIDENSRLWHEKFEDNYWYYCSEAAKYEFPSDETVITLSKAKENGDTEARNKLVEGFLLLVIDIAEYYSKIKHIDKNDLVQDGNMGLIRAADLYDYRKGYKFSTYATWWIRQSIIRGIENNGHTIRMPANQSQNLVKIFKIESEFMAKHGREPTLLEVSNISKLSVSEIALLKNTASPLSLSMLTNEDEESSEISNLIATPDGNVEEQYEKKELNENFLASISDVLKNERHYNFLIKRFGLQDNERITLEELGKELNITRERARQIESVCISKLRKSKKFTQTYNPFN